MNPDSKTAARMRSTNRRETYVFRAFKLKKIRPFRQRGYSVPLPRSGHRTVVDSNNLYSFGGYNPNEILDNADLEGQENERPLFRELWKFNFAIKMWRKMKTTGFMPKELASHSALLSGHYLLVYGGTGVPFGYTSSNTLHVCDLKTSSWHTVATTGGPPPKLYGQAMVLINDSLYVYGGTTGYEYSSDIYKLNLRTSHWEELNVSKQPEERYRHEIATDGNCIYVFGGGTSTVCFKFTELPVFDLKKHQWTQLKTLPDTSIADLCELGISGQGHPTARRCHSLVQKDENVYICGGYDGADIFPDIWRFNLKTHQWQRLKCTLPKPVYFHAASLTPSGCMFVFGGVTQIHENTRTSDIYTVWLQIPSLRDMCWQALLHYVPQLQRVPRTNWLEMGVPSDLVEGIDYVPTVGR